MKRLIALFALVAALAAAWLLTRQTETQPQTPQPTATSAASSQPAGTTPTPSPTPQGTAGAAASGGRSPTSSNDQLLSLLEKHSGTRDWTIHSDSQGMPFKLAGGRLKGLMKDDGAARAFLNELGAELGFQTKPELSRQTDDGPRLKVVDYVQSHLAPDGSTIPVFEASLRMSGDDEGDAFLIQNQLKPVDSDIRLDLDLDEDDAIEIARQFVGKPSAQFKKREAIVIFANKKPHQKVTQIEVTGVLPHKLLLVGHTSRGVVFEGIMSFD